MASFLLPAISSFALPFLGGLFRGKDPADELRQRLGNISNPQNQMALANQFYQAFLGSPAFSQAQGNIAAGQNVALNQLRQSLGARGLTTSGIGSVAPALAQSGAANQLAALRAGGYNSAQQAASDAIRNQIQALLGAPVGQNYQAQGLGAGLGAFGQFLQQYLLQKQLGGGLPTGALNFAASGFGAPGIAPKPYVPPQIGYGP